MHRSAIVALGRVRELQSLGGGEYRVVLRDGTQVPMSQRYRDRLAVSALVALAAAQLAASVGLVFWASLSTGLVPLWARILDVGLAFGIVITAGVLQARARGAPDAQQVRALRAAHLVNSTAPSVVLIAAWLLRERLDWNLLLPGLAWRLFILLYAMPSALAPSRPRIA